ncbi:MAG TPA: phosphatidylglycerophosphatase A [Acetobacteraceae bacterium]|nr:phosphatidylglycerophosphatase A [Acetobacteraceae bacterium]
MDSVRSWPAAARLARAIAGGFGCGSAPGAQGTVASAAATLVAAGLLAIAPVLLPLFAGLALIAGLWAIRRLDVRDDPGWVVIDEIAGQWIALLGAIGGGPLLLVAGFVLFRAFDILKPGPIRWAERLPGAVGVLADDVLAGVAAALLLLAARLALRL